VAISRLFVEIGDGVDRLNASLRQSMDAAKEAGIQVTASGQRMLAAFDKALNPSKDLAEQIKLLEKSGKSGADIWAVYGNQMKSVADATLRHGQAIDPTIAKHLELNKATLASKLNFESLGKGVQDFAQNPLQATQAGITSLLATLGPTAVGIGAVGAGAVAAAVGVFQFADSASEAAEQIKNLANATGMTVERVQELQRLGKERGLGDMAGMVEKLNVQLGTKAGGDFTEAILRMNIAVKQGGDAVYYIEQMRLHYQDLKKQIGDAATAQQMAADLGRRLVRELGPVLMSEESVTKALKEIDKSGATMSDAQINRLLELRKQIEKNGRVWESWKNQLKTISSEVTLAFMQSIIPQNPWNTPGFRGKGSSDTWGAPEADKGANAALTEQASRIRAVAEAEAIIAGTKREVLNLTIKQGELEKQYSEEKSAANKGLQFDPEKLKSYATQIAATKQAISDLNEEQKRAKELSDTWQKANADDMRGRLDDLKKQSEAFHLWVDPTKQLSDNLQFMDYNLSETISRMEDFEKVGKDAFKGVEESMKDAFAVGEKPGEEDWAAGQMRAMATYQKYLKQTHQEQMDTFKAEKEQIKMLADEGVISAKEASNTMKEIAADELIVKLSRAKQYFSDLSQIQNSNIRALADIGKAAAIAQATINTYEGATKALAEGGIWGAVDMAAVMAIGFAQVAAIASQGFKSGGYTGGAGLDQIAGVVHGQEFVMNADATKAYLPMLQMLNEGRAVGSQMDSGAGFPAMARTALNVTIANYGTNKNFQVEQIDENTVRIIARDEAMGTLQRMGPEVIANDMTYANSKTSKAIARHTTARRGDR
jgi:hypothetical protein